MNELINRCKDICTAQILMPYPSPLPLIPEHGIQIGHTNRPAKASLIPGIDGISTEACWTPNNRRLGLNTVCWFVRLKL